METLAALTSQPGISTFLSFLLASLYFYLPGVCSNLGAFFGMKVPGFKKIKTPVDFGLSLRGERIVGEHKLYGGFLFGVFCGIIVGLIKYLFLDNFMQGYLILDLTFSQSLGLSFLLSFFAATGDIIKSIIKRILNIPPHTAWIPFDEIDHSVTSLGVASIFFPIPFKVTLTIIISYFLLHLLSNYIGFLIKAKSVPY